MLGSACKGCWEACISLEIIAAQTVCVISMLIGCNRAGFINTTLPLLVRFLRHQDPIPGLP